MTEADLTRSIRNLLRILGVYHWKQWQGPMSQPKGVSDIIGIYKGRMLAIEVKTRRGRVSEYQQRFIDAVKRHGGIAFIARSVEDVMDALDVRDRFIT